MGTEYGKTGLKGPEVLECRMQGLESYLFQHLFPPGFRCKSGLSVQAFGGGSCLDGSRPPPCCT